VNHHAVVVATANAHKVEELQAALAGFEVSGLGRDDFPPEGGSSYVDNARAKARFGQLHARGGAWVVGEDSGIEADALDGLPGVESARWDADGVGRMLTELEGRDDRGARYRCVMVALAPDGAEHVVEGTLEGSIAVSPRGTEGFGYDPIFVPHDECRTVAELGGSWKREHSHRARAARALLVVLDG
jgi:XTP/dITP diphosphohydrolase